MPKVDGTGKSSPPETTPQKAVDGTASGGNPGGGPEFQGPNSPRK